MSLGPEPRSPSPGLLPLRAVASGIRVSLLLRTGVRPGRAAQEGEGFCVPTAGSARTAAFHPARPRSHPPPTGRLSPYSPFEQFLTGVTVTRGECAEPLWLQPPYVFPTTLRSLTASKVRMLEVPG